MRELGKPTDAMAGDLGPTTVYVSAQDRSHSVGTTPSDCHKDLPKTNAVRHYMMELPDAPSRKPTESHIREPIGAKADGEPERPARQ